MNGFDSAEATVLAVAGEVDVHTGPVLRARIAGLLDPGRRRLIVHLADVEFLDATGWPRRTPSTIWSRRTAG